MSDIGKRIKELREERGLTQEELGRLLDTHAQTVFRYEAGSRVPSVRKLEEIARALEVEPGELFPKVLAR